MFTDKKTGLTVCNLCMRPMVFYVARRYPGRKKLEVVKRRGKTIRRYQSAGPLTNPEVKSWCHGHCMGLPADLSILVDVMSEHVPKDRAKWAKDYAKTIERDFYKLVAGLARGKSS